MVAYFSMEVALDPAMPTYAGGLGVLAGDFVHAAADLGVPVVAVTLLHRKGYFRQRLDGAGREHEEPLDWPIESFVQPLSARIKVSIGGRQVAVRAWERKATGVGGAEVPVDIYPRTRRDSARAALGSRQHQRILQMQDLLHAVGCCDRDRLDAFRSFCRQHTDCTMIAMS
jgi:hypothetical protein